MRLESDDRSELVSQLLYGDCFKIIKRNKNWLYIKTLVDNYSGWIDQKQHLPVPEKKAESISFKNPQYALPLVYFLETASQQMLSVVMGSNVKAAAFLNQSFEGAVVKGKRKKKDLVATALMYLNTPYLWGGKTPFGIDCSGFTQMVYRMNGELLPRDAAQQAEIGNTLSFIDESEPGDLAFFDNAEGKIIHVGILLENHHIIHAHGCVRIDRIDQTGIYNASTHHHTHKLRLIKKIV